MHSIGHWDLVIHWSLRHWALVIFRRSFSFMPAPDIIAPRKKFRFLDMIEKPIEVLIRVCGWSSIIGLAAIFIFIFKEAAPMVLKLNWVYFFTSSRWVPNPGIGNEPSFGALALIVGTFATTFLALIVAVPF